MASQSPEKFKDTRRLGGPEAHRKAVAEPFKAKNCFFYKDGDTKFKAVKICIHPRRYQRMEALITELSAKVKLPFGVRSIFTPRGRDMVTSLDKLENGESYVCSPMRHQARGLDPSKVLPPPRWYYDKPSSGTRELKSLLQEYEFEDRSRYVGRKYISRDTRMAEAYNRAQPKKITVLKNGDPTARHVVLINRRTAQLFEQILADLSGMFSFAVRKLFSVEGRKITTLQAMINGPDVIVAAGKEPFRTMTGFVLDGNDRESRMRSRLNMGSKMDMNDRVASRLKKRRDRMTRTRGNWKVWCTTNELPTAGTKAQVTITVYGHKGNTGPIPLGFPDKSAFYPGKVDEFDLSFGTNIGEVYKIRIGHDNTGPSPEWFCDEVRMQDVDTGEMLVFPCRRWLSRDEEDHEICREMPAVRKGEPHLPVIKYEVAVTTGDLWNAGTDASVYLTIYGDRGDSGVRQLFVPGGGTARTARTAGSDVSSATGVSVNGNSTFRKGQTSHFTVEAVSLGHLKRVIIGHDGTTPGDGWFLEKLSVQEPEAKPHEVYHFYCGRWLDEGEDDGKIVRELKVQDEYMDDILEKRNWEYEKWKFESRNQVTFISMLTGKALRVKADGTVDGLGEETDLGSTFICSSKKPMVRVFTSLLNGNFHIAIDHGKVTGQGRGGPQCEFRIHVQSDRTVMLEGAKSPLQFVTLAENGKLGDSRSTLDKDPAKRFYVYAKGVLRHRGVIMLRTSNIQAISVDHDKSVFATGRLNRAAHFRCHKVDQGGIRMFESMVYPGFYLRFKDGKFDCNGSRNEDSHFLVEKHRDKGYFTLQAHKQRGMYIGFTHKGAVRPTVDTGTNNIHVFPEVIEYGTTKKQLALDERLMPISERSSYSESPADVKQKPDFEDGDYQVLISTDQNLEHGQVILNVTGDKGNTGPVVLSGPPDNGPLFTRGSTDEFRVNLAKVGRLLKARLELMPRGATRIPCWKVQTLVLVNMATQDKYTFDFNRWLSRDKEDKSSLARELPVVVPGREKDSLPVVTYFVTVYTGKDPGSETDAEVYINIYGDFGDSGRRELRQSNRAKPFAKGQSDTFEIEAVHLGNLSRLVVGHDETRPGKGWFLDKVVIREGPTANMEFIFNCGRWLDSSLEDRKLERVLMVQEPAPSKITEDYPVVPRAETPKEESPPSLQVGAEVSTHPDSEPVMEDIVQLFLYGQDGCLGPLTLGSGFKPGGVDSVEVPVGKSVGPLYKIRVGLAEEVPGCEWRLDKIKVIEPGSGEEYQLDCGSWMSRKKEDCDVWRELAIARSEEPPLPVLVYSVEVHTSDITGADTDAAIYLNLIGQRGDSGRRQLFVSQTEGKMFSQGKIDFFSIKAVSLGQLKSVVLSHSDIRAGCGTHIDYVAIKELNSKDEEVETYFPCGMWFDAGQDDGLLERELFPGQRPKDELKAPMTGGEYRLWVTTAADSQPAHGGWATLTVYGLQGHSDDIQLSAPSSTAHLFEPANADEFEVSTGEIGEIYKVRITREDKLEWKGWHVEEIKLEDKSTGQVFTFPFNRWLSRDMGDGDLSCELPVVQMGIDPLPVKKYEVTVATGDHWAAETDAGVWLTLYGNRGDTGRRLLHRNADGKKTFRRGKEDTFIIEAVDLLELETVEVSHTGRGAGAGWFLDHVVIAELGGGGAKSVFPCSRWLDQGEDDGKTCRTLRKMELPKLSVSHGVPSESGGQWKVRVRTSDLPNAGTRAQIYLTIHGQKETSHPIPLGDGSSSMSHFLPGTEAEFDVTLIESLGEITKIRLEHDGRNLDPSWHVDWVQLKHVNSGFDCLFSFDRWIAEDKEDGQMFRECGLESPGWMPAPVLRYIVLIQTGKRAHAGANGGICTINISGSNGDTGQQLLQRPLVSPSEALREGNLDVYMLEAVSVGSLHSVRLGFEGRGRAKKWYVENVKVMESLWAVTESVFAAGCWLDDEDNSAVNLPITETQMANTLPIDIPTAVLSHRFCESKGSWDLWVWTGSQGDAAPDEPVTLTLYGTTGPSQGIQLNQQNQFKPGTCVHSQIQTGRIGDLFKIRLTFPESIASPSWFIEKIKLKDCDTLQEFSFAYNDWMCSTGDNMDGMVELPAVRPDIAPLPESSYKVQITTGDLPCAETSAEVTLMLIGEWGDSGHRVLTKPRSGDLFRRGQVDEFELRLLSLGRVSRLLLGHSEHGRGQGWYPAQVAVTYSGSKKEQVQAVFPCHRWLDTGVDDRKTMREFSAQSTVDLKDMISQELRESSAGLWTVVLNMAPAHKLEATSPSDYRSHGVSLVVYGRQGAAGPIELGKFEPGQTETFKSVNVGDLGELTKVRVSHGLEGDPGMTWGVENVTLVDETTREKLTFDFSSCVGQLCGDARRERPVIRPGLSVARLVDYQIQIDTENAPDAGTSAPAYVTLYGSLGDSGRRLLHKNGEVAGFQPGVKQSFSIEAVDLGDLEKVVVTKGPGDPWLLTEVMVKAGQFGPVEHRFIWSNWVGHPDKRDEQVEITLPAISSRPSAVAISTSELQDFPVTRGQWLVETVTGEEHPGPASGVLIVFCGSKGESNPISLKPVGQNPFQSGQMDTFNVSLSEDVGDLIKIRIGFEDNSEPKMWDLTKIQFEDVDTKDTFWSSFARPIAVTDVSDGWTEFPVVWPGVFILPIIKYKVTVVTADSPGASTDQPVMVKLDGQTGSTGYRRLQDTAANRPHFQQGQTDSFVIEAVSLLTLDSITIGHDSQNPGDGWFLLRATVRPENEEEDYVFICNRWLDAGQDDGATMRTVYPSTSGEDEGSSAHPTARTEKEDEYVNSPVEAITVATVAGGRPIEASDNEPQAEATEQSKEETPADVAESQQEDLEVPDSAKATAEDWRVFIETAEGDDSGTDAQAILTVIGSMSQTDPMPLGNTGETQYDPGTLTMLFVQFDLTKLGYIRKVRLEHDNTGSAPEWNVHKLTLENILTGEKYEFAIGRWLSYKREHHDVVFEAGVSSPDGPALESFQYLVKIVTEAEENAGTDSNVHITLVGSLGDSGRRYLHNGDSVTRKFDAGKTDTFTLEAVDVGDLEKVIVGHDGGSDETSAWKLQCVMVRKVDPSIKESVVFPWGSHVSGGPENNVTIVSAGVTKDDEMDSDGPQVALATSDIINDEEPASGENDTNDTAGVDESNEVDEEPSARDGGGEEQAELRLNLPETARTGQEGTARTEDEGYEESQDAPLGDDSTYRTEGDPDPEVDVTDDAATARMYTASDNDTEREMAPTQADEDADNHAPTERESGQPTAREEELENPTARNEGMEDTKNEAEAENRASENQEADNPTAEENAANETAREDVENPSVNNEEIENPTARDAESENPTAREEESENPSANKEEDENPTANNEEDENPTANNEVSENPTAYNEEAENPSARDEESENPTARDEESENPTARDEESENPAARNEEP